MNSKNFSRHFVVFKYFEDQISYLVRSTILLFAVAIGPLFIVHCKFYRDVLQTFCQLYLIKLYFIHSG